MSNTNNYNKDLTPEIRREILAQYYESDKALPIDMEYYRLDNRVCGTTACIAGSTIFLFEKELWDEYPETRYADKLYEWNFKVKYKAAELLGLPLPNDKGFLEKDHLFLQFDIYTPEQAVTALRALNNRDRD